MHITINSFGTRGDIQPYIALAKGLQGAGHHVRILTHKVFESFVRAHGLDCSLLELDPREVLLQESIAEFGSNFPKFIRWLKVNFQPRMAELFRQTDQAASGADLLINSTLSFAGYHVAQKRSLPALAAYLQPALPTPSFHGLSMPAPPDWLPFKGAYNYLSTRFSNQMFFQSLLPLVNDCRKEVLGLGPLSRSYYWKLDTRDIPILFAYSPAVIPKPSDWGSQAHVTGYWFLDLTEGYTPPPALLAFLAAGKPPVSIGFGSMVDHEREEMTRLIVRALDQADQRAVLLGGWAELGAGQLPENIFQLDFTPHDWLFPRMAAVVHHGGAGTTAAGLRAGVPNVIVPFFADQFFWGWRVAQLGAGPRAIPRKELTAGKLAEAIRQAVGDAEMRARASTLGEQILAEDGIERAVELIEKYPRENLMVM